MSAYFLFIFRKFTFSAAVNVEPMINLSELMHDCAHWYCLQTQTYWQATLPSFLCWDDIRRMYWTYTAVTDFSFTQFSALIVWIWWLPSFESQCKGCIFFSLRTHLMDQEKMMKSLHWVPVSYLSLSSGSQEERPACEKPTPVIPKCSVLGNPTHPDVTVEK